MLKILEKGIKMDDITDDYKISTLDDFCNKKLLDVYDLMDLFEIGLTKARKIMHVVPHFRIGCKDMCTRIDLYEYTINNKLKINW